MPEIIKVAGLSKSYGDFLAVDDVSFSVGENRLFAFLGPNGAGKSTTGDRASVFFSLMDAPEFGITYLFGTGALFLILAAALMGRR